MWTLFLDPNMGPPLIGAGDRLRTGSGAGAGSWCPHGSAPSSKALTISTLVYTPVRRLSGAPPVPEAPGGAIVLVPLFLGPFVVPFNC